MIVFGDSLSAWRDGWVGQLMAQGHWYKLHAQSMRFGATGIVPKDILPIDGHKTAFYWLGTNDAALWNNPDFRAMFKAAFQNDMATLYNADWAGTKFNIVLILPPTMTHPNRNTLGIRAYLQLWAAVVIDYFGNTQIRVIDPDDHDVLGDSPDGVHLSAATATRIGPIFHAFAEAWEAE